jgi:multiple sugar transport system permease protein
MDVEPPLHYPRPAAAMERRATLSDQPGLAASSASAVGLTAPRRPRSTATRRRKQSGLARARSRAGMMICAPVVVLIGLFVVYPTIQAIHYSFTNWDGVNASSVGLANYKSSIFSGPGVHRILLNNFVFIVSVAIAVFIEYCVAYVLWSGIKSRGLLRVIYFIPVALSWAIAGILFRTILVQFAPNWLSDPHLSLLVVVLAFHWTTFGANALIIYAGLSTVDRNLIEAATLDGADQVRVMLRIVAPLVLSFIDFAVITTLILSQTNIFGLIYAFNFGGPGFATTTLEFNLYQDGFTNSDFGLAAATGVLLMLITIIVSMFRLIPTIRRFGS